MKKLKKEHFYFGAILTAIMEYNPDTSLVLLQPEENTRRIYKIQTNTSLECVVFFKYAFEKKENSRSWVYKFTQKEKDLLKSFYNDKKPVLIYLLCGINNLIDSEIAVLSYEEYSQVAHKPNFTIVTKKKSEGKNENRYFELHREKSSKNTIQIPRNRIEKQFDELIKETCYNTQTYCCPNCGTTIDYKV